MAFLELLLSCLEQASEIRLKNPLIRNGFAYSFSGICKHTELSMLLPLGIMT